jgi:methyl-accepting chemotaxis protein
MVLDRLARPMIVVSGRLRTGMRLLLLVVVLIVPGAVATAMYTVTRNQQIAFAGDEIVGTRVVRPMLIAMADTVSGSTPDLTLVEAAVNGEESLRKIGLPGLGGGSAAERVRLAESLAALIGQVGNDSNLILDPELDSFYVMDAQVVQLPKALVTAAQAARAPAPTNRAGIARRAVLSGTLRQAAEAFSSDLLTAGQHTDATGLAARISSAQAATRAVDALAAVLDGSGRVDPAGVGSAVRASIPALNDELAALLNARADLYQRERTLVLGITMSGFLIGGWFALATVTGTSHDVRRTVTAVTAIAQGDLSRHDLPTGRDELGDIGRSLAVARDRLREQDDAIREGHLAREQQVRSSFLHQRQAEAQFRKRTQSVVDESTGVITDALRRVTEQVGQVRDAADIINRSIVSSDQATASVMEQARQAQHVIASLDHSLGRVASTAELITGIAGQTRLLALNATIEAARAGDLGSGFTVVADEVKELANSTTRSTEQISTTIGALERETAAMSQAITTMVEGMTTMTEAANGLRAVVSDQDSLVSALSEQMTTTLEHVDSMSTLAAQLERRQHERIATSSSVVVGRPGQQPVEVKLVNISWGGLRCIVPRTLTLAEGDTLRVRIQHGDDTIEATAAVANTADGDTDLETGLQFLLRDDKEDAKLAAFIQGIISGL